MRSVTVTNEWAESIVRLLEQFSQVARNNPVLGYNHYYIENHVNVLKEALRDTKPEDSGAPLGLSWATGVRTPMSSRVEN